MLVMSVFEGVFGNPNVVGPIVVLIARNYATTVNNTAFQAFPPRATVLVSAVTFSSYGMWFVGKDSYIYIYVRVDVCSSDTLTITCKYYI